jgi:hypothetical protein
MEHKLVTSIFEINSGIQGYLITKKNEYFFPPKKGYIYSQFLGCFALKYLMLNKIKTMWIEGEFGISKMSESS